MQMHTMSEPKYFNFATNCNKTFLCTNSVTNTKNVTNATYHDITSYEFCSNIHLYNHVKKMKIHLEYKIDSTKCHC